ncbi:MAG TPA: DinB family protein [Bacteriovoracaceae bacterium]|nr:DinB family protein [Bacteriovoracaceae bacterium]
MKTSQIVDEFERSWKFTRSLTLEFAEAIPAEFWHFTFNEKYSPLCKQLRHMIWVTGLYTDALMNGRLDFKKKKTFYSGGLAREEIISALRDSDKVLLRWLSNTKKDEVDLNAVDAFGSSMEFIEFAQLLIEHEGNHHGLWSAYAALAGFSTPKSWKDNWGL